MPIIAIIEDDIRQSVHLKRIINSAISDIDVQVFNNSESALEYAYHNQVDLFLVDIGLPGENGLDFVKKLRTMDEYKMVWVIYVTANTAFMGNAINETHCYAYLTKPFDDTQLINLIRPLLDHSYTLLKKQYLEIKQRGVSVHISVNDILYIEMNNKELTIKTVSNHFSAGRTALYKVLSQLPSEIFIRCHRCFVINITYLKTSEYSNNIIKKVYLRNARNELVEIPVGSKYWLNVDKYITSLNNTGV